MSGGFSGLLERFRAALARSRSYTHRLLLRIKELVAPPHIYAAVVSVKEHPQVVAPGSIPTVGTRVRIKASAKHPNLVGLTGFVISDELDENGEVMVTFDSGDRGFFGVGRTDAKNPMNELESPTTDQKVAVIALDGRLIELPFSTALNVQPGDTVTVAQKTMAIVGVVPDQDLGEIVTVRRVISPTRCEIDLRDQVRVISTGHYGQKVEVGDRVVVDPMATVILFNFGGTDDRYQLGQATGVSWADIGGLNEAKRLVRQSLVGPIEDAELYQVYHKRRSKGTLILGPTGVGKTMLVRAAHTEMVAFHGAKYSPSGFLSVKGPELLRSLVGAGEAEIRALFAQARKHFLKYGYQAIIFIDESEALLKQRGTGISSDIMDTIVPAFLAEMDGLNESGAHVILATNLPEKLDPAVTRPGRIDRKIEIPRPNREDTVGIFRIYLAKTLLPVGEMVDDLAQYVTNQAFDPKYAMYQVDLAGPRQGQSLQFTLANLMSGAVVAGIIDEAIQLAIDRDRGQPKPLGVSRDNLSAAVVSMFRQNLRLNHTVDLRDFTSDIPDEELGRTKRLRQGVA